MRRMLCTTRLQAPVALRGTDAGALINVLFLSTLTSEGHRTKEGPRTTITAAQHSELKPRPLARVVACQTMIVAVAFHELGVCLRIEVGNFCFTVPPASVVGRMAGVS